MNVLETSIQGPYVANLENNCGFSYMNIYLLQDLKCHSLYFIIHNEI
jgi:hypothetical protein